MPTLRQMDVWMPFGVTPRIDGLRVHITNGGRQLGMTSEGVRVIARLRENVSTSAATAIFAALGERINPNAFSGTSTLRVSPLRRALMPPDVDAFAARIGAGLSALAALVLLIACSNLANLFLADVLGRRSEFAVRLVSGATRGHLVQSVLTETILLVGPGLIGGVVGGHCDPLDREHRDVSAVWRARSHRSVAGPESSRLQCGHGGRRRPGHRRRPGLARVAQHSGRSAARCMPVSRPALVDEARGLSRRRSPRARCC